MQEMQETWVLSPGGGNGNPPQYSCLENSMDRGAWRAAICGATKSGTQQPTRRLGQSSFPINTVELNAENTAAPTGGNRRPLQ